MGIAYLYGSGGGGSGGNLNVTAPEGVVVTVSNGSRSYSRTAGTSGVAKFTGLEAGTWTVSITDDTQTATTTVNIKIDHSATIAFFTATVTATFPTDTAECRCYYKDDPSIVFYANEDELDVGKAVFTATKSGTWVVVCTDGIDSSEKEISISSNGSSVSVNLLYHTYLYRYGDQCTSLTGGWEEVILDDPFYPVPGVVEFGDSSVSLTAVSTTAPRIAIIIARNKINFANYKTLTIEVSSATNNTNFEGNSISNFVVLVREAGPATDTNTYGRVTITGPGTYTIDTSRITGSVAECYVMAEAENNNMTITEVYLD